MQTIITDKTEYSIIVDIQVSASKQEKGGQDF